jgi:hypothetical protein
MNRLSTNESDNFSFPEDKSESFLKEHDLLQSVQPAQSTIASFGQQRVGLEINLPNFL